MNFLRRFFGRSGLSARKSTPQQQPTCVNPLVLCLFLLGFSAFPASGGIFTGNNKTYTVQAGQLFKPPFPDHTSTNSQEDRFQVTTPPSQVNSFGPFHGWLHRKRSSRVQSGYVIYDAWFEGTPTVAGVYQVVYHEIDVDHDNERYDGNFTVIVTDSNGVAALNPVSANVSAVGGGGQFSVTATQSWTASKSASWITLANATGSGNGTVSYTVSANSGTAARSGTITVGSLTHTVTQAGQAVSINLSPASATVPYSGVTGATVSVTASSAWSASSSAAWLRVTGGASGNGNGTVTYSVDARTDGGTTSRSGQINVSGAIFTVTQSGTSAVTTINPGSRSMGAEGGTGSFQVASNTNWTATKSANWITITSGASGSGNGTVGYSVAANLYAEVRTGTITVNGNPFAITQAGAEPAVTITPATAHFPQAGGTGSMAISSNASWQVASTDDWISVSKSPGSGNTNRSYTVAPNTTTSARLGRISVSGTIHTVIQAGNTGGASAEIIVSGNGADIINGDSTPWSGDSTDFGVVKIDGDEAVREFTILNIGDATLNLTATPRVQITGAQAASFSVISQPASASVGANGGTQTFRVRFDPAAAGVHNALVTIASNDQDESPFTFAVRGLGTAISATVTQISAGNGHSAVILSDGSLWAWGYNHRGQLGDGTTVDRWTPVRIGGTTSWSFVACGEFHTLGVRIDGTLWAWGYNHRGQLGDGTRTDKSSPVQIGSGTNWKSVSTGSEHTLALRTDGTLWTWGAPMAMLGIGTPTGQVNSPVQVGTNNNWASVSCGYNHSAALRTDGSLWTWGDDSFGQLGDDGFFASKSNPVQIQPAFIWKSVFCSSGVTRAIRNDGSLWSWGYNGQGQLGDGTTTNRPTPVRFGTDTDWASVGTGESTYLLKTNGTLWKLGTFNSPISRVDDRTDWVAVAGWRHYLALRSNGGLWSWGYNSEGQLGLGFRGNSRPDPALVGSLYFAPYIEISGYNTVIGNGDASPMENDGTDFTAVNLTGYAAYRTFTITNLGGANLHLTGDPLVAINGVHSTDFSVTTPPSGEVPPGGSTTFTITFDPSALGLRSVIVSLVSDDIESTPYEFIIQGIGKPDPLPAVPLIATGQQFTMAVLTDGSLWGWGRNNKGQLGDGTITGRVAPVRIGMATDWVSVACGWEHTLGIRYDGSLWGWGDNALGQLGDGGATTTSATPKRIGDATNWVAVACGELHTVGLKADGTLWAWGIHRYNQPGGYSLSPVQIGGGSNKWIAVECGQKHTVALREDGTLWAWGYNTSGELGDGTMVDRTSLVQIGDSGGWVTVACGYSHTVALRDDGTLWAWGRNFNGSLGDGTTANQSRPVRIGNAADWVSVTAGSERTVAVRSDGSLWAWGRNSYGQLGDGTTIARSSPVQIGGDSDWITASAASEHTAAVRSDGSIWTFGVNTQGQLGDGSVTNRSVPTLIGTLYRFAYFFLRCNGFTISKDDVTPSTEDHTDFGAVGVSGFSVSHTYTITNEGSLPLQLDGAPRVRVTGQHASDFSVTSQPASQLEGGEITTFTIRFDPSGGGLRQATISISNNDDFRNPFTFAIQGTGKVDPFVPSLAWPSIAGGLEHTVAVRSDGTLWTWGGNSNGQLGDGTTTARSAPVQIGDDEDWASVACGYQHTVAVRTDGTLWAWGDNAGGQLGNGTAQDQSSPVRIGSASNWASVACGLYHTVAVRNDGTLWAWGQHEYVHPDVGGNGSSSSPMQVRSGLDNWVSVACGDRHTVAIRSDGSLWGWGYGSSGQLGDGTSGGIKKSPVRIGSFNDWAFAEGGDTHTVASRGDGSLWSWGYNIAGQLGDGTTTNRLSPVQVGGAADWRFVAAGYRYTVSIRGDGSLWAWGYNGQGQLGDGTTVNRSSPVRIGDATWALASCGTSHTVGMRKDGSLWAWGANNYGQLGDGTTATRTSPVEIFAAPILPEITILGNGIEIVSGDVSPSLADHTDFGKVFHAGAWSVTRTFVVANTGNAPLSLSGSPLVAVNGTHGGSFTVTSPPANTVPAGGSTSFTISFDPPGIGQRNASIVIQSNDADEGQFVFSIRGEGVTAVQGYHNFMAANSQLTGPDAAAEASPFGDGVKNLLKYAFNMNLGGVDIRILVPGVGTEGLPFVTVSEGGNGNTLYVEFVRRRGSGLVYTPQRSPNLDAASWTPFSSAPQVIPIDDQWERVIYVESPPGAPGSSYFARVKVDLQ
jgi:alpha-tubulin suppressor-like RCC1 family protein